MSSEITRLTTLIKEDKSFQKIGDFEKHTKAFGSSYLKKYGFVKGKGLDKNDKVIKNPFLSSRTTRHPVLGLMELFLGEWYLFIQRLMVSN
jgi:hypothetical protein